ncbi:MAG: cytochrome oxidase subunit III [Chitinophagaceae bacterium]|jgi:cytochrome c oxidase subunit 3|nr:MAG: cytochrome oxidase subunit III [Chitinophagaceae bacterium]
MSDSAIAVTSAAQLHEHPQVEFIDKETNTHGWWRGGVSPFNVSYGKLMMWIFLLSDTFTFGAFLVSYGSSRFSEPFWPDADVAFDSFFGIHATLPLLSVSLMTFILIMSSVTMVLAVHAGHLKKKKEVAKWLIYTIVGGLLFLGCQAFEWVDLITTKGVTITHNMLGPVINGHPTPGPSTFGAFFFLITGFHGCHVFSGVILNFIILMNVVKGTYERRGHYEMVEKVGLYWHFVDLVWVYIFTCFYLF